MGAPFGLLGAGAQTNEVIEYAVHRRAVFRAVTSEYLIDGVHDLIDIDTRDATLLEVEVVAAVGDPVLRRELVRRWGGTRFTSIVHSTAVVSPTARIAPGAILAPTSVVSTNVTIGEHAIINIGASVSHDSVLGGFVSLSPGARIAGGCHVGDGVFFGVNASVLPRTRIADGVAIGAGAVVIDDLSERGVYAGVPARLVRQLPE